MNKKEQTNIMRYIDQLICDVEKVLTGLGYKMSIELNTDSKLWCIELLNANSSEEMPIRHKSMIRGLVKGYLHSFDYFGGTQKIYIYDECKGLHPEDDRYSTLEYAMSRVSDCNKNDLFVNYGTYTERYVINNNENDLFTNYGIHTDRHVIDNGENSEMKSDDHSSNSPNGYGKYIDDELNKAATRYFAENTDPNKYSLADVFYHGYRCGARKEPIEGNQIDESVKKRCVPLIGLSGKEYNEKFIENMVSGKFLTCMIDFDIFKAGEKYWLEYIGDNNYIGRSDNILNEKIHLEPRQLDYFIEIKDDDENVTNVINWFYRWFYGVRTWGLTNNESNEEFCTAEAINAYKEFRDSFIIQLVTNEIYDTEKKDMEESGFVTKRVAELLRLKGFNGKTNHYYADGDIGLLRSLSTINWNDVTGYYSAPIVQEAIDWLETKGYWIIYHPLNYDSGVDTYIYTVNDDNEWYALKNFVTPTKYEGLNKALEFCIDNFI